MLELLIKAIPVVYVQVVLDEHSQPIENYIHF